MTTLRGLEHKLELVAKELDGGNMRERLGRVGQQSRGDIDAAVRRTLGDQSMSGWKRGSPVQIRGTHKVLSDSQLYLGAGQATGLMRVLQDGRNPGGGFAGPGRISADGTTARGKRGNVLATKRRGGYKRGRVGQANGRTAGKGTWDDAASRLADNVPPRVAREVHRALAQHLNGG